VTKAEVRELQRDMNRFTGKFLHNFPKLRVDGVRGHSTNRRIQTTKWYLGYTGKPQRSSRVTKQFRRRLEHPKNPDLFTKAMLKAGEQRRKEQRAEARHPTIRPGVKLFDGRPCAAWLVPYLDWAREHGWDGTLVSGWRDPVYSEKLCYNMCGQPSCPGKCAGRSSNHSGTYRPKGAVDVSYYWEFGQLMKRCPISPRLYNALGARDPVHFSASGR